VRTRNAHYHVGAEHEATAARSAAVMDNFDAATAKLKAKIDQAVFFGDKDEASREIVSLWGGSLGLCPNELCVCVAESSGV
jgi:hypothetical protein